MAKTIDLSKSLEEIIKEEKKTKKMKRPGDGKWKNKKSKTGNRNTSIGFKRNDVFIKRKQIIIKGREKRGKIHAMRQEQKKRLLKTTSLLVSNIANGIKAEELRTLFESIGKVRKCELDKNEQGKPLGTARVCYYKAEHAEKAVKEYDQSELDGRLLCIKQLETMQK